MFYCLAGPLKIEWNCKMILIQEFPNLHSAVCNRNNIMPETHALLQADTTFFHWSHDSAADTKEGNNRMETVTCHWRDVVLKLITQNTTVQVYYKAMSPRCCFTVEYFLLTCRRTEVCLCFTLPIILVWKKGLYSVLGVHTAHQVLAVYERLPLKKGLIITWV